MIRRCAICKIQKNFDEFYKDKRNRLGITYTCKECIKDYNRNNLVRKKEIQRKVHLKMFESWSIILPKKTNCEICGIEIYLKEGHQNNSIHFDHRHGENNKIKSRTPSSWLHSKICNKKNLSIWEAADFGFLCKKCNMKLPTNNRKEWFEKAVKYIYGEDSCIYAPSGAKSICGQE